MKPVIYAFMNASNATVDAADIETVGKFVSDAAPSHLLDALERLAYNAALEARLSREESLPEAVAAVRRISLGITQSHGLEVHEDDRGDVWAVLHDKAVAFLGHSLETAGTRDAD